MFSGELGCSAICTSVAERVENRVADSSFVTFRTDGSAVKAGPIYAALIEAEQLDEHQNHVADGVLPRIAERANAAIAEKIYQTGDGRCGRRDQACTEQPEFLTYDPLLGVLSETGDTSPVSWVHRNYLAK